VFPPLHTLSSLAIKIHKVSYLFFPRSHRYAKKVLENIVLESRWLFIFYPRLFGTKTVKLAIHKVPYVRIAIFPNHLATTRSAAIDVQWAIKRLIVIEIVAFPAVKPPATTTVTAVVATAIGGEAVAAIGGEVGALCHHHKQQEKPNGKKKDAKE